MGNFAAPDYRYNPFNQSFSSFGHGYLGNPKEVHTIPASAPYFIYLNEIPRSDSPSTLLVNQQAGSPFTEVSFSTPPAAGQFRAVYGGDETQPLSIIGQGTIEFNSADAGKIMEFAYYGMGAIVQNQIFNKLLDGFYGIPDFAGGLTGTLTGIVNADTINEKTATAGVTVDSVLLKDNTVNNAIIISENIYNKSGFYSFSGVTNISQDFIFFSTSHIQEIIQVKLEGFVQGGENRLNSAFNTGVYTQHPGYPSSPVLYTSLSNFKTTAISAFAVIAVSPDIIRVTATFSANTILGKLSVRSITTGKATA